MQDIPDAISFTNPRKKGCLLKLTGKGWLYSGCWKKRYCILDGTKFYYFENEKSRGSDKATGVISLDYYDMCEEFDAKDKKFPNVFIIGTSVRGFFDNRHQFAAETEAEMQDWIRSVHDVITEARNIRIRAGRSRIGSDKVSPVSGNRIQVISQMSDGSQENELKEDLTVTPVQLINATKDRVRGPQGRRLPQRKSMMPAGTTQLEDDGVYKQRSFSLSGPNDDNHSEESPGENRRVSLSMDFTENQSDEVIDTQRSSSSNDILTQRPHIEPRVPKKPIFGKLGGQHAALTKELEMKLKSGLAPGGNRFHEPHEGTSGANDDIAKKTEALSSRISSMEETVNGFESKLEKLREDSTQQEDSTSVKTEIRAMLAEARALLKETKEAQKHASDVAAEAREVRDECRTILMDIQSMLPKTSQSNGCNDDNVDVDEEDENM